MHCDAKALRKLIEKSGLTLPELAEKAKITYQPLQRWYHGRTTKLSLLNASAIHHALTGKPMLAKEGEAA